MYIVRDDRDFQSQMSGTYAALVDFSAEWCGPCKGLAPVLHSLEPQHPGVKFFNVDIDKCPDLGAKYKVAAMPTLVLIINGKETQRVVGADVRAIQGMLAGVAGH